MFLKLNMSRLKGKESSVSCPACSTFSVSWISSMKDIKKPAPVTIITLTCLMMVVMGLNIFRTNNQILVVKIKTWDDLIHGKWYPLWSLSSCRVMTRYQTQAVDRWDLTRMGPRETANTQWRKKSNGWPRAVAAAIGAFHSWWALWNLKRFLEWSRTWLL